MAAFTYLTTKKVTTNTPINEVQTIDLGDIAAADTFTLTYNAHTTGTITYSTDMSADITAGLVGLSDFEAGDVSTTKTSLTVYVVTFGGAFAGVNAGAITITNATGFTPVGVTETTSGRSQSTSVLSTQGRYGQLMGVRWGTFVNGATNELLITDAASRTLYSVTGKDTSPIIDTFIGQDGRDQAYNASANLTPGLFEGPLTVRVRNQVGATAALAVSGIVEVKVRQGGERTHFYERGTGTIQVSSGGAKTVTLRTGAQYVRPLRVRIQGFDSSTDFAITDADGSNVFTKTALDATTALDFPIGYDGEDQAGNAAADSLPGVFQGPFTVAVTNGGTSTTGSIKFWLEG